MILLLASILLIGIEALYEGLALAGHKTIAGGIESVYLALVTLAIFAWLNGKKIGPYGGKYIQIIGGYVLMRFAIFDIIYNLVAGIPLFFIGTTKWSDILWNEFFALTHFPVGMFFGMLKLICFLIGLTWLLKT